VTEPFLYWSLPPLTPLHINLFCTNVDENMSGGAFKGFFLPSVVMRVFPAKSQTILLSFSLMRKNRLLVHSGGLLPRLEGVVFPPFFITPGASEVTNALLCTPSLPVQVFFDFKTSATDFSHSLFLSPRVRTWIRILGLFSLFHALVARKDLREGFVDFTGPLSFC